MLKKTQLFYQLVNLLAVRDVKVRYQLSILGLYWAVLNPFLMALVWGFVFNQIFRSQGIAGVPYLVFLFCGITFWNFFSNSLTSAVNSLVGNASMLSKVSFPRLILPTASVVARLVDFLFFLFFSTCSINDLLQSASRNFDPMATRTFFIFFHVLFTLGLAYIISAVNVFYRDVSQIISIILMLWMYVSPVLYTLEQIPEDIRSYFIFNPIGQLVYMEVNSLLGGVGPNLHSLLIASSFSIIVFFVGILVFKHYEDSFAEVM